MTTRIEHQPDTGGQRVFSPEGKPSAQETPGQEANRKRRRRRLVLAGILPGLIVLFLFGKISMLFVNDIQGHGSFDSGDYMKAESKFRANGTLNWFQSWISPYDEAASKHANGLKLFSEGEIPAAKVQLNEAVVGYEIALESVPEAKECLVRTNLALALEARGDLVQQGPPANPEGAIEDWRAGIKAVTDGDCTPAKKGDKAPDSPDETPQPALAPAGPRKPTPAQATPLTAIAPIDSVAGTAALPAADDDAPDNPDSKSVAERLREKIKQQQEQQQQEQQQERKSQKEKDLDKRNEDGRGERNNDKNGGGKGEGDDEGDGDKKDRKRLGGGKGGNGKEQEDEQFTPGDPDPKW